MNNKITYLIAVNGQPQQRLTADTTITQLIDFIDEQRQQGNDPQAYIDYGTGIIEQMCI